MELRLVVLDLLSFRCLAQSSARNLIFFKKNSGRTIRERICTLESSSEPEVAIISGFRVEYASFARSDDFRIFAGIKAFNCVDYGYNAVPLVVFIS